MALQGGQSPFALAGMPMGTSIKPQMQYLKGLESSGWYMVSHYSEDLLNDSEFLAVYSLFCSWIYKCSPQSVYSY